MRLVRPKLTKVWTSRRKWLGNLIPAIFWLVPTAVGVVLVQRTNVVFGPGLWLVLSGLVLGWLGLNYFGLFENGRIRRDSMRNLTHRRPPAPGPVVFVGCASHKHRSMLDAHEDVGFLAFGPEELEFIGDTVESLRAYDPESQRSVESLDQVHIVPLRETFPTEPGRDLPDDRSATAFDYLTGGAEARIVDREVRSYEAEHVNGLWHWDCHHGSRKVITAEGEWVTPILFGVLDDRSRLACHLQWYLAETAEVIAHGLSQAFQKRGLPRAALSDNGSAMLAAEVQQGLERLGIVHETTPAATDERTLGLHMTGRATLTDSPLSHEPHESEPRA